VSKRDLDVVVFGATGVTGRRVAAYLAEQSAETGARWAPAARDAEKLKRILGEDGVTAPETIEADVGDPDSLARMASRARVVLNLVGPYTLHGRPVIEACVDNGAHYLDLTGEIPFVRDVIDEFDKRARRKSVKVVQVSGFEALPPDLAVLLASETSRDRWGEDLAEADLAVSTKAPPGVPRPSDLISGGTLQSMAEVTGADNARVATDPAALIDDPARAKQVRKLSPIGVVPRRGHRGVVLAPMTPAAFINPAVIHRTAALTAKSQRGRKAEPFRYREGVAIPGSTVSLPLRLAAAAAMSGTQVGFGALARSRPKIRKPAAGAMRKVFPSSGFGPSADRLEDWLWGMAVYARTSGGHEFRVSVDADGHPGYLATARMIGEAGLLLAEDDATPKGAGCLTPAIALGTQSVPRFARAQLRFSVDGFSS
jgi:short subunit dehydrogenase-like uncharacterized protein